MNRTFIYFMLELKKGIKLIPFFIKTIICTVGIVSISAIFICKVITDNQLFEKIKIGIVISDESDSMEMIMKVISGMKSVKSICDFEYVNKEEADSLLKKGDISASIELPDHLYDDISSGVNTPVTVTFASNDNLEEQVFQELISDGVSLFQTAQCAVYAITDASERHPLVDDTYHIQETIIYLYLENAFDRNELFDTETVSALGELSLWQFYFAGSVLIVVLMFGLGFEPYYHKEQRVVSYLLRRNGIGRLKDSLIKLSVITGVIWLFLILLYCIYGLFDKVLGYSIIIFDLTGLLLLLPFAFSVGSLIHAVYTIGARSGYGSLFYLMLNLIMIICAGGLVPVVYLPGWIQKVTNLFPLSYWQGYLSELFWDEVHFTSITTQLGIGVILLGIGMVALNFDERN